jgi:Domain of unknown function (DUF4352)
MTINNPPIYSHRRTGLPVTRVGRIGLRVGSAVLIVVTLAIGAAFTSRQPSTETRERPFTIVGNIGKPVNARTFDLTVLGVRGAAVITDENGPHDTSGVWIIVRVRLTARNAPTAVNYAVLADAEGRTYRATERIDQPLLSLRTLEPGIPVDGELAFEVPVSVADNLSIRMAKQETDLRMDALAQIHLPITSAEVDEWHASTKPVTVAKPGASQ